MAETPAAHGELQPKLAGLLMEEIPLTSWGWYSTIIIYKEFYIPGDPIWTINSV